MQITLRRLKEMIRIRMETDSRPDKKFSLLNKSQVFDTLTFFFLDQDQIFCLHYFGLNSFVFCFLITTESYWANYRQGLLLFPTVMQIQCGTTWTFNIYLSLNIKKISQGYPIANDATFNRCSYVTQGTAQRSVSESPPWSIHRLSFHIISSCNSASICFCLVSCQRDAQ